MRGTMAVRISWRKQELRVTGRFISEGIMSLPILGIFERWVNNYVTNWATCDTLCNHSVGTLIEMYPEKIADLKKWAKSPNRWMKRASAVSLIVPARKGLFIERHI